ncbi:polar growth protein [Quaeritorhiza haematococci]|nr:polar growth protein [Quaeritorhiza haematococci]
MDDPAGESLEKLLPPTFKPFVVYGKHTFTAEEEDELSFGVNEPLVVLEKDELYNDGWWRGMNMHGQIGLFPANFITFDSNPNVDADKVEHLNQTLKRITLVDGDRLGGSNGNPLGLSHRASKMSLNPMQPLQLQPPSASSQSQHTASRQTSPLETPSTNTEFSSIHFEEPIYSSSVPASDNLGTSLGGLVGDVRAASASPRLPTPAQSPTPSSPSLGRLLEPLSSNGKLSVSPAPTFGVHSDGSGAPPSPAPESRSEGIANPTPEVPRSVSPTPTFLFRHPETWEVGEVADWLERSGFHAMVENFVANRISGEGLFEMTLSTLREIGIDSLGDRITILHAILSLKDEWLNVEVAGAAGAKPLPAPVNTQQQQEQQKDGEDKEGGRRAIFSMDAAMPQKAIVQIHELPSETPSTVHSSQVPSQDSGFVDEEEEDDVPQELPPKLKASLPRLHKANSNFTLSDYMESGDPLIENKAKPSLNPDDDLTISTTLPRNLELQTNQSLLDAFPPSPGHNNIPSPAERGPQNYALTFKGVMSQGGTAFWYDKSTPTSPATSPEPYEMPPLPSPEPESHSIPTSPRLIATFARKMSIGSNRKSRDAKRSSAFSSSSAAGTIGSGGEPPPPVPPIPSAHLPQPQPVPANANEVSINFSHPDYEGWLFVRIGNDRQWKKRWCVLKDSVLYVLKGPETSRVVAMIPLNHDYTILPDNDFSKSKFAFQATSADSKAFHFACETQLAMVSWINVMVRAGQNGMDKRLFIVSFIASLRLYLLLLEILTVLPLTPPCTLRNESQPLGRDR